VAAPDDRHPDRDDVEDLRLPGELREHDHAGQEQQQRRDAGQVGRGLGPRQEAGEHEGDPQYEQADPDPVEDADAPHPGPPSRCVAS
jgi:hypothetical protein